MELFNKQKLADSRARIAPYINETPIVSSSQLNRWLGHEIYFKAEGFQKIGAFKARGACNTLGWLNETGNKPDHVIANSSGNHAQAVAWASGIFGTKSTIFMPDYSSKVKIQATRSYGADVVLCKTRDEADDKVRQAATQINTYWIPPFNHEMVIYGQATATQEALEEVDAVDAVFGPCGGGGLLSGTLTAARLTSPKTEVIGSEPKNANDASLSLQSGEIQRLKQKPDTLADGAMTLAVGDITFEYLKQLDDFQEVTEESMIYWTQWLTHLLKIRIEPTSALSMETARKWLSRQKSKQRILIILTGANIDQETNLKIWEKDMSMEIPGLLH